MALFFATLVFTTTCLLLTIKTLNSAEQAMSYGGFANEIIKNDFKIKRIENSNGMAVIQNNPAEELFAETPILTFLEQRLADNTAAKTAFQRLQNACGNLCKEDVTLSLSLQSENGKIFSDEEWFKISVRPIFLKKTDIFNGPFSIKAIKKDTFLYWSLENITAEKNMEQILSLIHI